MPQFVHLHVHTQYSILDGQASVQRLVDKAMADGQPGIAVTDHGDMFGIKEFYNYVQKVKGKCKDKAAEAEARIAALRDGTETCADPAAEIAKCERQLEECRRKLAFKPIIGCEVYVARRRLHDKEGKPDQSGYHLILLAKNLKGYHNLIKIVSKAWTEGFYMRPRTDRTEIEKYHEGLICCSACLAGEVPRAITANDLEKAEESIRWHKKVFGDDYYLELQLHKATVERANHEAYPMQLHVNKHLRELAAKHNVRMVCTNDVHFVDEDNAEAHDRLICLSTGKDLDDPKRMLYSKQEWLKTTAEMAAIFGQTDPEAMSTTVDICNQIECYSIDHAPIMPSFSIPEDFGTEEEYRKKFTEEDLFNEFTRDENGNVVMDEAAAKAKIERLGGYEKLYRIKLEADYLAKLTYEGAVRRYGADMDDEIKERLKFELYIMKTMGFPGYFLIVQDFINAARNELGVLVGPGRGSAAGSVVAYCLGITKIDPIKYDLLFERFLNPDRISLPDIDTDFDDDGRGRVLEWVEDKYGHDKVAHIITYGTMATKNSIKDVARVEKLPLDISNHLCKAIPDRLPDGMKMNLPNAIKAVPELREAEASPNPQLRNTIRYAKMLEGTVRGTGIHACGTIICRDAISDWVPVSTAEDKSDPGHKLLATQYDGHVIEETGLIKMDFLGLSTLSILKETVDNIKLTKGIELDLDKIPIDDAETYKLYQEGRTVGTFQFESAGMQKYLRELKPTVFEDLIAMNALYRPGPMDYIPQFIRRKNGQEEITYDIPCMEKYLKDTYGITVYQEQVMLLSRQLANFTRGESDALRKAMGKKKKDIVDKMKPKFIEGGKANGHDPKVLEKIWADWEKFASYAFNKSHATCYSWVAYQTAYLKAHYPAEFMAGNMSRCLNDIGKITKLMSECKAMGIKCLGPDVNESRLKFSANKKGEVRFGLGAVKGMGDSAAQAIITERDNNGPYKDIYDFAQRVNLSAVNRKAFESLALSGGFDSFGMPREQYFGVTTKGEMFLDTLVRYGQLYQMEKMQASNSLFGGFDAVDIAKPQLPQFEKWSTIEKLNKERDLVGIYLSAHPLDDYSVVLNKMCNIHCSELGRDADKKELAKRHKLTFGGIVTGVVSRWTKTNKPYGFVTIEDYDGPGELALFGDEWARWQFMFKEGYSIYLTANCVPRYRNNDDLLDIHIMNIDFLNDVKEKYIEKVTVMVNTAIIDETQMNDLSTVIKSNPGKVPLYFMIYDDERNKDVLLVSKSNSVDINASFIQYIESCPALSYTIN